MKRQQAQPLSLKIQKDYNLRTPRRGEAMESVERRFGARRNRSGVPWGTAHHALAVPAV